jgi:hypothetical protein
MSAAAEVLNSPTSPTADGFFGVDFAAPVPKARSQVPIPQIQSVAGIDSFCKARDLPLSTVIQTAWSLLLWRYTSSENIKFGSVDRHGVNRCELQVDETSIIADLLRNLQVIHAEGDGMNPTADVSDGRALLDTLVRFQEGQFPSRNQIQVSNFGGLSVVHRN